MDAEKKDQILAAATELFNHFGYKKTSIEDVARKAGVAKGTVYLAISSKSDLLFQCIHRSLRNCMYASGQTLDPRMPADQLLPLMIRLELGFLETEPLLQELILGSVEQVVAGERFDELRRLARNNFVQVLQLGQRQGVFREDVDVEAVATMIQDLEAATFLFHREDNSIESPRWQAALRLIIDGLRHQASV